jgi:tetratricopeptide (TPR) repeat protein
MTLTASATSSILEGDAMKGMISLLCLVAGSFVEGQMIPQHPSMNLSPVEQSLAEARNAIAANPGQYQGYNLLAAALVRRAQQTSDSSLYAQSEAAINKSLQLAPDNFETEKIQVSILLGEHDFPAALDTAKALNKRVPDDVMVYGLLTDANMELGNYKDAEIAAQWMLNLRPGNLPALIRAAKLRELFGDPEGAYELMELALQSTSPADAEERASLLAQMGHLRLESGSTDAAEKLLRQATALIPNYPSALLGLAKIRIMRKQFAEAVALLEQRYQTVQRAENLYDLADALQLAGRNDEANRALADFERSSIAESGSKDNSNRKLVFYYADNVRIPVKALGVAKREFEWRHDVFTLDAYAWALHVNGQDAEARKQIETALAVGIRDASLVRHAAEIAAKMGDTFAAEGYLKRAADLSAMGSDQARAPFDGLLPTGKR